jgi:hypothetical protein
MFSLLPSSFSDSRFDSVATLFLCVFYGIATLFVVHVFCFSDVCKDNPDFTDIDDSTCSYYRNKNCSHEIMSEDLYDGVVENCPWSCGLCEGWSPFMTRGSTSTRILSCTSPPPPPSPSTLCNPSCQTGMLDHPPFPALWFLCVSFGGVPACIIFHF